MNLSAQQLYGAGPVFLVGSNWLNMTTSVYAQVKTGIGVLSGVTVNTAGTSSAVALYDGISSVVTISLASPGVITWNGHPFKAGDPVVFETTSALPTGLTAGTVYYVSITGLTANAFEVSDTKAHALAGTNMINTSVSQAGVQTAWDLSNPIGTFATTAQNNVPLGVNGVQFQNGLIASATDGGGAANITILYL